jgi:ADP-ribose pyrophosphatase YjhB (NUDIX family)
MYIPSTRLHSFNIYVRLMAFITIAACLAFVGQYYQRGQSWHQDMLSSNCAMTFGVYNGPSYRSPHRNIDTGKCIVQSKWMRVMQHKVRLTDDNTKVDKVIDDWLWIDYHDRVNVLVHSSENQFYILRQTKYALEGRQSLAVVGGIIEPGDTAEATAIREVQEEMQAHCQSFHFLGRFRTDVNRGLGWVNSFLAMNCHRKEERKNNGSNMEADVDDIGKADTEQQIITTLSLSQLREELRQGSFLEVQWSNTVALALLHDALL